MAGLNMNTTTLEEGPEARDEFITEVFRTSGILKLVPVKRITHRGESIPVVPRTTVEEVGETNLKPYSADPITSLVARPITLATTVGVSKQLIDNHKGILAEVAKQGASDIAEELDAKAAGDVATAEPKFGQLKNVATGLPLTDSADWYAAIAALSAAGASPSGLYLSEGEWARLKGLRFTQGAPIFNIEGNITEGTFEGIPYATFRSVTPQAYLGDFAKKAVAGTVYDIDVDINPYGGAGEGEGFVNFWSRNMIGVRAEGAFAFNFIPSAFVKFVAGS